MVSVAYAEVPPQLNCRLRSATLDHHFAYFIAAMCVVRTVFDFDQGLVQCMQHQKKQKTANVTCEQMLVIVSDVRLLVGPLSCMSPFTSRQSHQVSPRISNDSFWGFG